MESCFAESHGCLEEVNSLFIQLERHVGHPDEIMIEESIQKRLESITGLHERLEVYIMKEPPQKRQISRLKLNQMKYDADHLRASLRNFQRKRQLRERAASDREELMSRRFTSNSSEDTSISIDHSIRHNNSLQNANRGMDDILGQGYAMLGNLQDQKATLKRTKTRMLSFINTLGLSNTVMQLIERRAYQDKYVLYGGMIVTSAIIFLVYMYFV